MFRFSNPRQFMKLSKGIFPVALIVTVVGMALGYAWVWTLPEDYMQGRVFKIMYVHVPSAWLSMGLYGFMALCSLSYLIWRHMVSFFLAEAAAWVGATVTAICVLTGMLWGKPTWGAWWVWDARLTSVLILFFLYIGYLVFIRSFDHFERAAHNGSLLALFGALNLPVIKWSVNWWHTLHQPASITKLASPSVSGIFLWPLIVCALGWVGYVTLCVVWITWGRLKRQKL